nr:TPA_asm: m99.5 sORF 1 [Murid betaherpesvirus 1]DBA07867.1 TPA_asm: m99.5 sORF 1 [Murid betaherpesvirus 1]
MTENATQSSSSTVMPMLMSLA